MTLFRVVLEVATPPDDDSNEREVLSALVTGEVSGHWLVVGKNAQVWDADYKTPTVPHHVPDAEYAGMMREEPK
jgi:hypothetical protein